MLCFRLRPENVPRTVTGPKTVPCSVSVYDPRTSRRPSRTVAGPKAGRAPFSSTSQERHVGPSRIGTGPKTVVLCSVYIPRTSRGLKPNSHRSQDRAMLYSRLRPENVTSAQAEQSPVPRPCRALFPSTSRERPAAQPPVPRPCLALCPSTSGERHVGPSRAVASPKTVSCSVSVYDPRTSPAQSPVPRQCLALFPSTTRERHVGPAEQSPVLRPVVLRFRLRPKNVTSAQAK